MRFGTSYSRSDRVARRTFLASLAALPASGLLLRAQSPRRLLPLALNHMTLSVSDIGRSLDFYQKLFGMPIVARQADTLILGIGEGPQFLALSGGSQNATKSINHFCLTVDEFDVNHVLAVLGEHRVESASGGEGLTGGALRVRVRMRGEDYGGAPEGTPELYFGDPDGVVVQLQEARYCGGKGLVGEICAKTDLASSPGLFKLRDLNHFTLFVSDQARSIAFYQGLFGMPIKTYQGALPLLSVGSGSQFLALAQAPTKPAIHHACLTIDNFQHEEVLEKLTEVGVRPRDDGGSGPAPPMTSYVTPRMADRGGARGGTPELYFTDPDGILLQLQDTKYCGGSGYLGDGCS